MFYDSTIAILSPPRHLSLSLSLAFSHSPFLALAEALAVPILFCRSTKQTIFCVAEWWTWAKILFRAINFIGDGYLIKSWFSPNAFFFRIGRHGGGNFIHKCFLSRLRFYLYFDHITEVHAVHVDLSDPLQNSTNTYQIMSSVTMEHCKLQVFFLFISQSTRNIR